MKCFDCNGTGINLGQLPLIRGLTEEESNKICICRRCKGTGDIDDRAKEWFNKGDIMFLNRVDKNINLRTASKKLKIDVIKLSDMEQGIIEPDIELYDKL